MALAAGGGVGSTQTKAVIINEDLEVLGRALIDTGANVVKAAEKAYLEALTESKRREEEIAYVIGTGYGRYKVTFGDTQVTEISCHGRGAVHMFPKTRTVLDMGGQDTKAISVSETGEIVDFCMNDKNICCRFVFFCFLCQILEPIPEQGGSFPGTSTYNFL